VNAAGPPKAAFRVTLDGRDLTERFAPRLISLRLCEKRDGEADELELQISDHDGRLEIPNDGAELEVSIGWARGPGVRLGLVEKGRFKVDEVSWAGPPDMLTIKARSADFSDSFRIRREVKRKVTTLGAVLGEIARDNGLAASIAPELASIAIPVLAQDQRSDAALLRFLGRRYDAVATVKGGKLVFAPIGKGSTAGGRALPAFSITRKSGDSYSWQRAAREEYDGVEARWHDKDSGERKTVVVESAPPADAPATGKRKPKRLRRTFHSEADAKAAAQAEQKRVQRAAASFELTLAFGNAELYPEQQGKVTGFKPSIDATTWLAEEVTHTMDGNGGFRTGLKLERYA